MGKRKIKFKEKLENFEEVFWNIAEMVMFVVGIIMIGFTISWLAELVPLIIRTW